MLMTNRSGALTGVAARQLSREEHVRELARRVGAVRVVGATRTVEVVHHDHAARVRHRAHVHDARELAPGLGSHDRVREREGPEVVHAERRLEPIDRGAPRARVDARVVHEHVEPAETRLHRLAHALAIRLAADIQREELALPAGGAQALHRLGARLLIAISDEDKRARLRERGGDGRADAGAGPGDEGDFIFQRKHGARLPSGPPRGNARFTAPRARIRSCGGGRR